MYYMHILAYSLYLTIISFFVLGLSLGLKIYSPDQREYFHLPLGYNFEIGNFHHCNCSMITNHKLCNWESNIKGIQSKRIVYEKIPKSSSNTICIQHRSFFLAYPYLKQNYQTRQSMERGSGVYTPPPNVAEAPGGSGTRCDYKFSEKG